MPETSLTRAILHFTDVVTIVLAGFSFSCYFLLFVTLGPTSHDHKVMYIAVGHSQ